MPQLYSFDCPHSFHPPPLIRFQLIDVSIFCGGGGGGGGGGVGNPNLQGII